MLIYTSFGTLYVSSWFNYKRNEPKYEYVNNGSGIAKLTVNINGNHIADLEQSSLGQELNEGFVEAAGLRIVGRRHQRHVYFAGVARLPWRFAQLWQRTGALYERGQQKRYIQPSTFATDSQQCTIMQRWSWQHISMASRHVVDDRIIVHGVRRVANRSWKTWSPLCRAHVTPRVEPAGQQQSSVNIWGATTWMTLRFLRCSDVLALFCCVLLQCPSGP